MTEENTWHKYKVSATIRFKAAENTVGDTTLGTVESNWIKDKNRAVRLANELEEKGYSTEIETQEYQSFVSKDYDKMPSE